MNPKINLLLSDLNEQLNFIDLEIDNPIKKCEKAIEISIKSKEKLGSYISLLITAIIFGALHLANPNSTLFSGLCVGIEAGFLMGAAYIYARNIWFPIAIHFAWNFMQSGIFGAITSGNEKTSSLPTTKITGSPLFTGGEFGPEGTIQALLFCSLASIFILLLSTNKLVLPYWKKL